MAKLYFRYGAMTCGKTTALLQVVYNYERKGMKAILVKPAIDTKGEMKVVSRVGISRDVDIILGQNETLLNKITISPNAIMVDEAQFLTPVQVDELYMITKIYEIPVICYGLRCDFQMKGFPGATRLLEIADDIEELKTICKCGSKATQNMRLINGVPTFSGEQVVIDDGKDNVSYEATCGKCYV